MIPQEISIFETIMPMLGDRPTVFDIGAHRGSYSDFVLSKIPEANCYLFEPNKEIFRELARFKNAYNMAISSNKGSAFMYTTNGRYDELSSLFNRPVFEQTGCQQVECEMDTVDNFCLNKNIPVIDLLKIDTEGAELEVLKGCQRMLSKKSIRFIQVEYGGTYPDSGITFKDVLSFMEPFGYRAYDFEDGVKEITKETFVEDFRFANFLITCHDIR